MPPPDSPPDFATVCRIIRTGRPRATPGNHLSTPATPGRARTTPLARRSRLARTAPMGLRHPLPRAGPLANATSTVRLSVAWARRLRCGQAATIRTRSRRLRSTASALANPVRACFRRARSGISPIHGRWRFRGRRCGRLGATRAAAAEISPELHGREGEERDGHTYSCRDLLKKSPKGNPTDRGDQAHR